MKKKWVRIVSIAVGVLLLAVIARCGFVAIRYRAVSGDANWRTMPHPFYSADKNITFIVAQDMDIPLHLWWDGVTGSVDIRIVDGDGYEYFHEDAVHIDRDYSVSLCEGIYGLQIDISGFTGGIAIGYDDIVEIRDLPDDRYTLVPADPAKGFMWEYLLYVPNTVTQGNILVVPNNTGFSSDSINIHREEAKKLIIEESELADALGVPLLVPVFPRSEEMYTHALDRATMLTGDEGLERIDLQLIAMIDDAMGILRQKGIEAEDQILMSGFSASGDFIDRFTVLHPEIVKAASLGGAQTLILPCVALREENLPYPLGIYDYEIITGEPFDMDAFSAVYRRLYKGSADENGWMNIEENGKAITYTGKEYYEKCELPQIVADLSRRPCPIYTDGDLTDIDEKEIAHRVFDGKIVVERFRAVSSIFSEMGLDRNEFVVYDGVGHDITDEMEADELRFFQRVLTQ